MKLFVLITVVNEVLDRLCVNVTGYVNVLLIGCLIDTAVLMLNYVNICPHMNL